MSLTSAKKLETNKYELVVAIDPESFDKAVDATYRKNIKKINVPGFRKGKAPRKMVEKIYGEGIFYEDAINSIYPSALRDAVKEANLELVDHPEVEITEVSREKGVEFKAVCITKPEVELSDYKGIKVTKKVKTVQDEDIDAEISKMRDRNSRIVDVDDRPAKNGDITVIDFEGFVDGKAFEGGKGEKFSLTLGSGQFIPGFEEQVEGHSVGEEFDVNVTFPENYHVEELKGKPAVFKVKLHEIKYRELPELDDEFAKDVSEFDTLAELREDIGKKLAESYEKSAETETENKLVDVIVENMKAEIPQVMFENRINDSVREFEYRLKAQGLDLATYLQYSGMDMDTFRNGFREQAEKQVKIRLALEKVVELENIVPTDEDIEAEYGKLAALYNLDKNRVKELVSKEEISLDIAVNKAVDLIKENAQIVEEKEDAEDKKASAKKTTTKKTASKKTTAKKAEDEEDAAEEKKVKKTTAKKAASKKTEDKKDNEE